MSALTTPETVIEFPVPSHEKSFPFPVWSGLLTQKHYHQIKNSLWMFLWLLDRTTTEENGWGVVLGGKPVKDEEIADCFGFHKNVTAVHRGRLVSGGYVDVTRTPYGFQYRIRNSRKFGIWGKKRVTENCDSLPRESQETVIPESQKTVETKKTMQLDHAVKAASSQPQQESVWGFLKIDPCGPLEFRRLLENCWGTKNGELASAVIGRVINAWEDTAGSQPRGCGSLFSALSKLRKREAAAPPPSKLPTYAQMIPTR